MSGMIYRPDALCAPWSHLTVRRRLSAAMMAVVLKITIMKKLKKTYERYGAKDEFSRRAHRRMQLLLLYVVGFGLAALIFTIVFLHYYFANE